MLFELICLALIAGIVYFLKFSKLNSFFEDRGIPYVKPIWPFGSDLNGLFFRAHPAYNVTDLYKKLDSHKIGGFYAGFTPNVMVRDPEYVQRIYTTDFGHFVDRSSSVDEKTNPLDGHLFLQTGAKWRYLRHKLSPIFTSGKLKWMYEEMEKCADAFMVHLEKTVELGKDIDMKEDTAELTTEVISSCAFGIDAKAIGNPDGEFRRIARLVFERDFSGLIKTAFRTLFPGVFKKLKIKTGKPEVEKFIMDLVKQSFEHRLNTGYTRNDFIQLLLQLREKGSVEGAELEKEDKEDQGGVEALKHIANGKQAQSFELDDNVLGAQLFIFFAAGFETTASTIYHLIYLFSKNQEEQDKARKEIETILSQQKGLTYDSVKDLTYLEACVNETLRMFPPVPFNFRVCTKDYTFPDGTHIETGTRIILPTYALHYDDKYFPEPKKFRPERFLDDKIVRGSFAPFGDGPRICIGKRFALVEIKLAFARILPRYRILPSKQQNNEKLKPGTFLLVVEDGLKVKIEKIAK